MQLISEDYRKLNTDLHESNPGYGANAYRHIESVMMLTKIFESEDILDYGCGKSSLAINLPFPIKQYDPAVPKYSTLPKPADIVTCTDVLEHIEPYYLEDVLDHLQQLTRRACFVVVSTVAARKTLADGRNAHLIQKPAKWWMDRLWDRFELANFELFNNEFRAVLLSKN